MHECYFHFSFCNRYSLLSTKRFCCVSKLDKQLVRLTTQIIFPSWQSRIAIKRSNEWTSLSPPHPWCFPYHRILHVWSGWHTDHLHHQQNNPNTWHGRLRLPPLWATVLCDKAVWVGIFIHTDAGHNGHNDHGVRDTSKQLSFCHHIRETVSSLSSPAHCTIWRAPKPSGSSGGKHSNRLQCGLLAHSHCFILGWGRQGAQNATDTTVCFPFQSFRAQRHFAHKFPSDFSFQEASVEAHCVTAAPYFIHDHDIYQCRIFSSLERKAAAMTRHCTLWPFHFDAFDAEHKTCPIYPDDCGLTAFG